MRISDWSSDVCSSDLLAEPALIRQFELIRSCTKIVYGVAGLTEDSMVFESGFMSRRDGQAYIDAGAVGVAIGRFFDEAGAPVAGSHDGRMVGISLDRSEEHTSELQSLMRISYAVFCLKKKKDKCTLHKHN